MATTPTWSLPYPVPSDPPAGNAQLQSLATTVDTTLNTLRTTDNPPWVMVTTAGLTLPTNTGGSLTLQVPIQHAGNYFTLDSATTLRTTRSGLYQAMVSIRGHCTPVATGLGGFFQAYFESPPGAQINDMLAPTYGIEWQDILGQFLFRWDAAKPLAITGYNNCGQNLTFVASRIFFAWTAA